MPKRAAPANLVTSWAQNASAASGLLTSNTTSLVHSAGAKHSLLARYSRGLSDECGLHPALHSKRALQVVCTGRTAESCHQWLQRLLQFLPVLPTPVPATRRLAAVHLNCLIDRAGRSHRTAEPTGARRDNARKAENDTAVAAGRRLEPAGRAGGVGDRTTHDKASASAGRGKASKRSAALAQPAGALDAGSKQPTKRVRVVTATSAPARSGSHKAGACDSLDRIYTAVLLRKGIPYPHPFCSILLSHVIACMRWEEKQSLYLPECALNQNRAMLAKQAVPPTDMPRLSM